MNPNQDRAGGALSALLASLLVAVVVIVAAIYLLGYATVEQTDDATRVEIQTERLERDSRDALESTRRSLEKGAEEVRESLHESTAPADGDRDSETPRELETTPDPAEPPREIQEGEI